MRQPSHEPQSTPLKRDTFTSLHYHIVFATYRRRRVIEKSWRPGLHAYIAGILRKQGGVPLIVGGVSDHVHILTGLRPNHCLSDIMREVKHESSRWIHENHFRDFSWQKGYSAFTVSPLACDKVRRYIAAQEEHHHERGGVETTSHPVLLSRPSGAPSEIPQSPI